MEKTFTEIAKVESKLKHRIQEVIVLALLAPDVIDAIVSDEQPDGLTTK